MELHFGRNGSSSGSQLGELSELFFVAFHDFGEGFDGGAQVRDFGSEAGQGSGVGLPGPVFVDDGAQLLIAVERRAADLGLFGHDGEGDRAARSGELGADTLDPE
jgi:hypothetical protein